MGNGLADFTSGGIAKKGCLDLGVGAGLDIFRQIKR
jgi:hypothetical protein